MYKKVKKVLKKALPKSLVKKIVNQLHYLESLTANVFLGFPGRKLKVIGVTGTSGKSTTTAMIAHIFNHSGKAAAYFGTTNAFWAGRERENVSSLTTETPCNLYKRVKTVENAGDEYLIVESSAHAVVQHRLAFLHYVGGVFTNLSHDHLDYFGTMQAYARAKQGLFKLVAKRAGWGVFVAGDEYTSMMSEPIGQDKQLLFGINDGTISAMDLSEDKGLSSFSVIYQDQQERVDMPLTGEFNVKNALAAIGAAVEEGVEFNHACRAMNSFAGVRGRMERFETKTGAEVLVDFAHTPEAFELVLSDLRKHVSGKIIAVYGGYGDRDKTIRAPFGRITATYCDHIILTEDLVGSETVESINADIRKGIAEIESYNGEVEEIEAREEAIARAVAIAKKGDCIALLGKGHEKEIKRLPVSKPWDELQAVKDAIAAQEV